MPIVSAALPLAMKDMNDRARQRPSWGELLEMLVSVSLEEDRTLYVMFL